MWKFKQQTNVYTVYLAVNRSSLSNLWLNLTETIKNLNTTFYCLSKEYHDDLITATTDQFLDFIQEMKMWRN